MTRDQEAHAAGLMRLGQAGDQVAYASLLVLLTEMTRRFVRARVGNAPWIDDVVQETLLAVHGARQTYDSTRPFAPWFYAIASSRFIDVLRREKRVATREVSGDVLPEPVPAGRTSEETIDVEAIHAAVRSLPTRQREVIEQLAMLTMATAIAAAASALVLSVPAAERSPAQRGVPLLLFVGWLASLTVMLVSGGSAMARLMALPVHIACVIEIAGFALIPGWALFTMLRRAAPLKPAWTAVLAALAATALGAAVTQLLCPIDEPAHHLVGHVAPAALFTAIGAFARQRSLSWPS